MKKLVFLALFLTSNALAVPPQQLSDDAKDTVAGTNKIIQTLSDPNNIIQYKVGTFTSSASTGNQSVTGLGFRPRLIILGMGAGAVDSLIHGWGAATASDSVSMWGARTDDTNTGAQGTSSTRVILWTNTAGTVVANATLVSMDTDGFTLNWSVADSRLVGYIAFQ